MPGWRWRVNARLAREREDGYSSELEIGLVSPHDLEGRGRVMLWTLIVILLILWLLGAFVRPVGGLVHVLLVIVLILLLVRLL